MPTHEVLIIGLSDVLNPFSCTLLFLRALSFASQIQSFNLASCPGSSPKKLQAGFDARIVGKAFDPDGLAHFIPAILFHQLGKDHFKSDAVKRIFEFLVSHAVTPRRLIKKRGLREFVFISCAKISVL
jgi:hypothetical protein